MADTPNMLLFNALRMLSAAGVQTQVISSAATKTGAVYKAPKTGNIRYIGTTFTALSGSPALTLRAETVSSRLPTGTLFGTNTNASYSPSATDTFVWTQLTADAAVTAGDMIAAVVGYTSGTSATSAYTFPGVANPIRTGLPYAVVMSAGSWAASTQYFPAVCFKYDDGTIISGSFPASSTTTATYQSGTNPNERASVFTAPFGCAISGVIVYANLAATATITVAIYEGTSTTAMTGGTITVGAAENSSANGMVFDLVFASPITLTSGTSYRIGVLATAAANVIVPRVLWPGTAERDVVYGALWADTRNGSSWVGESTTTTEMIFPVISSVTSGGAGVAQGLHSISSGIIA